MSARIAIGFGATSAAHIDDIVALVRASLATLVPSALLAASSTNSVSSEIVIATLDRRVSAAHEVARTLACDVARALLYDVVTFDAPTLAGVDGIVTPSQRALAGVGTPSVAEAAALAALRPARARLVVPRTMGHRCTCAIAEAI